MINLDSALRSLEVKLAGAITTLELTVVASYVDISQADFSLTGVKSSNTLTNGGTAVTAVAAPAATTSRQLKALSVHNTDSVTQTVTVQYNDNGTKRVLITQTLTTGQTLQYDDSTGWTVACVTGGGSSLPDPVTVPHGGTGDATLANHGVLLGQATAAVIATAVGASNTVLHGNSGADPTYSAVVEADITLAANTTNNVTGSKHGFAPKSPADATKFLNGADPPDYTTPTVSNNTNDFRLTLTSGAPFADSTTATTLYATPLAGNSIALYDGANWNIRTSAEFSLALGTLTANLPYDVFCYDNATVPTLEFLAWSSDTTRATALVLQNGVYVKSGATTRRYLGSFRTISTTASVDTPAQRYVWNYYHRVARVLRVVETTATWTYTTAVFRQANGSATNQVEVMIGVSEDRLELTVAAAAFSDTAGVAAHIGIGEDSTTARQASNVGGFAGVPNVGNPNGFYAIINCLPAAGRHVYAWLELGGGVGTTTWYSTAVGNSGLTGFVMT